MSENKPDTKIVLTTLAIEGEIIEDLVPQIRDAFAKWQALIDKPWKTNEPIEGEIIATTIEGTHLLSRNGSETFEEIK